MKKFLLVAFVALMASTNAKAQSHLYETTDEVSIAYGAGSCLQIIDDILTVFTLPSHDEYESKRFIGPLSVEYFHHFSKVVSVGAVLSYSHSHRKVVRIHIHYKFVSNYNFHNQANSLNQAKFRIDQSYH